MTPNQLEKLIQEIKDLCVKYKCNIVPVTSREFKETTNSSGLPDFQLSLVNWPGDLQPIVLVSYVKQMISDGKRLNVEYNGDKWRSF